MPPELSQLAGIALAIMGAFWITLWATPLFVYLGWRNWGVEDARYARLRAHVEFLPLGVATSRFVPWLTKS
ncbi:MAG: hypothetical protein ACRETT_15250 [Steroidobacteraceae bacterium]